MAEMLASTDFGAKFEFFLFWRHFSSNFVRFSRHFPSTGFHDKMRPVSEEKVAFF
jgi:hypothetical protein